VRDADPALAARVANEYPRALNELLGQLTSGQRDAKVVAMERTLDERRARLSDARQDLQRFMVQAGVVDLQKDTEELARRRAAMVADTEKIGSALRQVQSRIDMVEERLRDEAKVFVSSRSAASTELAQKLQKDISDIQADLAAARAKYTDKHPTVQRHLHALEEKKHALATEMDRAVSAQAKAPDSFYERLRRQAVDHYVERAALEAEIGAKAKYASDLDAQVRVVPAYRIREDELRARVTSFQRTVDSLTLGLEEARAQDAVRDDQVVVLEAAEPAAKPMLPLPALNAGIAAGFGLLAGIYLAFLAHYVRRIHHPQWALS
jgi:uncharacterized protein involved in exopolysaccharide biosynthesis